eukprot:UN32813
MHKLLHLESGLCRRFSTSTARLKDIGITYFLSNEALKGKIKHNIHDFQVREISLNDELAGSTENTHKIDTRHINTENPYLLKVEYEINKRAKSDKHR